MRLFVVLVALSTLSGCYFLYPKASEIPELHPKLAVEGARLEVRYKKVDKWHRCFGTPGNDCVLRDGDWYRQDRDQRATAWYNGEQITWGEFYELADPDYKKRVETVRALGPTCKISIVPTALAVASLAVGFLYPLVNAGHLTDDEKKTLYIVGGSGAVVFTALSYPLGGYACHRAEGKTSRFALAEEKNLDDYVTAMYDEVQKLADDYNARAGVAAPAENADGASEETPPADEEPAEEPAP